ncbi:sensor histidine kinase [Streptomyces orinoci]|uniref:histidine kinase n=1 Tax=Streptomyces orinoci TaxID=67339 RepID=A0ABV3K6A4_STRON|nr:histidine kinase [Streptomyces orinoci]
MARQQPLLDRLAPSWLVVQLLGTVVLSVILAVSGEDKPWVWALYAASCLGWLLFVGCGRILPDLAHAALIGSTLLASAAIGFAADPAATAMCSVLLGRLCALDEIPVRRLSLTVGLVLALPLVTQTAHGLPLSTVLFTFVLLVVAVLLGLNRRQYAVQIRQARQLLEQTECANAEQARAAALAERSRIAREIHDVLAHSLGALSVQLEVADALLSEHDDVDQALARVRRSRRLVQEGLREARRAVAALRGDVPSLQEALAELGQEHQRDHRVAVAFQVEGEQHPISSAATVSLLQAAREALTNAGRHAPWERVEMTLRYRQDSVGIEIRNRLPEEPPVQPEIHVPGYGLTGMHERLALVGGTLAAGPQEKGADGGEWWLVTATVPK